MAELLALDAVTAGYGASVVLEEVSLSLAEGDSLALLGRNGVGKTTLLVTLMGLTRVHRGALRWRGNDLATLPTYRRAQPGLRSGAAISATSSPAASSRCSRSHAR